ncbi:MAG: hypothetical protein HY904_23070 [Deltaproteobacteria bacterium]|nr:hypothetical protein [Deltaproteobacteria bacterium]
MPIDQPEDVAALTAYLAALPAQKLILRRIHELRPTTTGRRVEVGVVCQVEVVSVVDHQRVSRVFCGVTQPVAVAQARAAGHDVIERNANHT